MPRLDGESMRGPDPVMMARVRWPTGVVMTDGAGDRVCRYAEEERRRPPDSEQRHDVAAPGTTKGAAKRGHPNNLGRPGGVLERVHRLDVWPMPREAAARRINTLTSVAGLSS
jgi:hypothetical protein